MMVLNTINHYDILGYTVTVIMAYIKKILRLGDFNWIIVNKEKNSGYYSFKFKEWEISLDTDYSGSWCVYLSNKWQEVLEEYSCANEDKATRVANNIYRDIRSI